MIPRISVICAVRNEAENVPLIFKSLKPFGALTELIFVEGFSTDTTWQIAKSFDQKKNRYGVLFRTFKQTGTGKSGAVSTGFDRALGKYLIIMDADLTISRADHLKVLSLFNKYGDNIVASGNRLAGLPKPAAFYWINYLGNYFFRYYFSIIFKTQILDFACGTKAVTKTTWKKIKSLRSRFGRLDSWGDLDWLYYGFISGCRIKFVRVGYTKRLRGISKLQNQGTRWKFALNMAKIGLRILKLTPRL
jgi:glycosyltransferase involved in cell wall biosynthesis